MKSGFRVAIVGNCQARPMARLLARVEPRVEIVGIVISHLGKPENLEKDYGLLSSADIIFAQTVQDSYPVVHLRSSALRSEFGGKLLVWPNLFFEGQTPDLVYLTATAGRRIVGPLGEYQNRFIYEAWKDGCTVDETVHRLEGDSGWAEQCLEIAEESLIEIERRAADCELSVAESIREHWRSKRMFFTFNHPSNWLVLELLNGLLARADVSPQANRDSPGGPELLDRVIPTLPASIR